MLIIPETEGYTNRILSPISALFSKCGFQALVNHCYISPTSRPIPISQLTTAEYAPIQTNIAYFMCTLENKDVEGAIPPIMDELQQDEPEKSGSIFLELGRYSKFKEWVCPWEVSKDLVFFDKISQTPVGWYNKHYNILWMSDIGNYEESALGNIELILKTVLNYKITGYIPTIKITIGSDPEFEILNPRGDVIPAYSLFPDPNRDRQIGMDGHSETGELRPTYASNPIKLARNIKRLVRKLNNNPSVNSGLDIFAGGGTKLMTGGHIHFGISQIPEDLKDALWKLVATPVLKFQGRLRNQDTSKCRKGGGDVFRNQNWGVEWRPLPSFIINQEITEAVLCTAYVVVKSFFLKGSLSTTGKNAYTKLPLYLPYKTYIDRFVELFVTPETESLTLEKRNILKEWRLSKINKNPSVVVTCADRFLEKYFTPLYVKLNNSVRIRVTFSGDSCLHTEGLPEEADEKFRAFASKHFIDYESSRYCEPNEEDREGRERVRDRQLDIDSMGDGTNHMCIHLPHSWIPRNESKATNIFRELKDLIKEAIIEYDSIIRQ